MIVKRVVNNKIKIKKRFVVLIFLMSFITVNAQENIEQQAVTTFENENPLFSVHIGGTQLATRYREGEGTPIIFVHGSWADHNSWLPIASSLSLVVKNPIILYDRRGHSASLPDFKQGSITEDVNDVMFLMKTLGFEKACFVGHSYGANIVVKLATQYPEAVEHLILYEPPLFGILKGKAEYENDLLNTKSEMLKAKALLEKGEIEKGTIRFVEKVAFGNGSWTGIFNDVSRAIMLSNYRTWLDQTRDPQRLNINPLKLNDINSNIIILYGESTLPVYIDVVHELDKILKNKQIIEIKNAGHGGISTSPREVSEAIKKCISMEGSEPYCLRRSPHTAMRLGR